MNVGELVAFKSDGRPQSAEDLFIVVDVNAHDLHTHKKLPHCVMIMSPSGTTSAVFPMDTKFLRVLS
jgi:hypothetical protein